MPLAALAAGLVLGAAALIRYDRSGYSHGMLYLWLAALALLVAFFASRARALPAVARLDLVIPPALAVLFSPLYLVGLYHWPVQVSSDEVAVMAISKDYASVPNVDLFGLSNYFARPTLLFVTWGKLGHLLGGIDLYHMRILEATLGLVAIAASYALFRQVLPRGWAICSTCLLGLSHSYLVISRMAMRENTAVLVEVIAFALLLWGLRNDNELATFLGGIVAGLGFYVYYPSRAVFPLWVLFLIGVALLYRSRYPLRAILRLGAVGAAGFVLMAGPIGIAEKNAGPTQTKATQETLMFYNAGREIQKGWVFASSQWDGYWINVKNGLGTFNNTVVDHGWIYQNPGHGFVDPLTGLLLWLGAGLVGVALVRRRAGPEGLLFLGGFLVLWLSFAFIVNKAPNYTRLLVTLPLVAYLVTEAIRWLAGRWRSVPRVSAAITVAAVAAIGAWNLSIAWDFIQDGRRDGDIIGNTARYVVAHRNIPNERFYISAEMSDPFQYYEWGWPSTWQARIQMFAKGQFQVGNVIHVVDLPTFQASPPFALFMRRTSWAASAQALAEHFPRGRIRNVTPDGSRVVLEVPAA